MKDRQLEKKILEKINLFWGKSPKFNSLLDVRDGDTPLIMFLVYNKLIHLSDDKQIDYLIKNSDLSYTTNNGWNSLMFAIHYQYSQKLSQEQWLYLIDNSNLLQVETYYRIPIRSVLGLAVNNAGKKLNLADHIFEKAISNKKFKLKNYENDVNYLEIQETVKRLKTKNKIEKNLKISSRPNNLKI